MGQQTSSVKVVEARSKVSVEVSVPAGPRRVDALTLSYSTSCWWRNGRRRVAKFTFPRRSWSCRGGEQICAARETPRLPLAALRGRDGSTAVRVKATQGRERVFVASVTLAQLQALLERAVEGDTALLKFVFAGGDDAETFTTLTCNGWWRCDNGGREGPECPGHGGSGRSMEACPGHQQPDQLKEGEGACPSHREDGRDTKATPGHEGPDQLEGGEVKFTSNGEESRWTKGSLGHEEQERMEEGEVEFASHGEGGRWTKASPDQQVSSLLEKEHPGGPATDTQACDVRPEESLRTEPDSAPVRDTAWGVRMGYPCPSFVNILENTDWLIPEAEMRHPKCSAQCCACVPVPEIDLADSSSLALLRSLYSKEDTIEAPLSSTQGQETVPGSDGEEPSSVKGFNTTTERTVPGSNDSSYAQSRDAVPTRRSRWMRIFVSIVAVVYVVTATVLLYNDWQQQDDANQTTPEATTTTPMEATKFIWGLRPLPFLHQGL